MCTETDPVALNKKTTIMKRVFSVLAVILALFTSSQLNAQTKIGYISTEELISVMPETAKADSNLQQFRNALVQNAQDKQSNLESAIEKFNKDSVTMTVAVKDVKRGELQKLLQDLSSEEQRIQQQLQQRQQELLAPINKKAFDAIQAVAKESAYAYIFEKGALLVAPPADDVLPLVAKKLNIKLPAPGTRPAANPTAPAKQ
jgi:outer membrane protein